MVGALWTGISGLAGQQTALDNESHNIANVNTIGYKASRISFADQMYQDKIGKGTQILDTEKLYIQGNLKVTGVNYDMALAGDGFFSVSSNKGGGTSEVYYTRAGNFRMGDSGTLQDASGNDVQGWAMSSTPTVESSNPNVDIFTNDYTKMLSSKIIQYTSAVETITAKATDYTLTAKDDDEKVFSGSGLKTRYGKIADVEELVKAYTEKLQNLKDYPNSSSASASTQRNHIDLPNQTDTANAVSQDGDEVYVYINGNKVSQSYISGTADAAAVPAVTATQDGYLKTMKAFADKISEIPGLKAYVAEAASPYTSSTANADVYAGTLRIESIIPGGNFTITGTGMVHAGLDKPGTHAIDTIANQGSGLGALETVRDALNEAITGKQTDVYTPLDLFGLANVDAGDTFTYSTIIYDKGLEKNVIVPNDGLTPPSAVPISFTGNTIADFITAINTDANLNQYIVASNINGNLVIKTKDSNFDVEYAGDMKNTSNPNDVKRNADYSGREGAGAEFMEIKTRIDQAASKGSLQLRLDTLRISDSAFGDFSVDSSGLITMNQDGASFAVGQVAVAKFITNRGLEPMGDNLLKKTLASGDPIFNLNNDKTADIKANTLELSTADLSESLVNLMVFQRAFEANAKSITTADTILNTLIQLKR